MFIRIATRNLFRNPRRTLALLATVAFGTGSLFIFHGFNTGVMNQYLEHTVHYRYGHGQLNMKGYRDTVFEKPWEHWIENWPEISTQLKQTPEIQQVFPRVEFFALLSNGNISVSGRGQGVNGIEESKFFNTLNIESGVTLADQPEGILLGKGLARALDAKPGDRITVLVNTVYGSMNGGDFVVTGIFHTGTKEFDDVIFRVPLVRAQALLDTQRVETIALALRNLGDWKQVSSALVSKFPRLEATSFAVLDEVYYQHSVDWLSAQFGVIQFIIILIVVMGIFTTVSTGILERKQEIGNLRANGESTFDVMTLLLCESAVLGMSGALLGLLLAIAMNSTLLKNGILMPAAPGLTRQFHVWIELQAKMAVSTFFIGVLATCFGSLVAGLPVARMPIGEALRST